MGESKNLLIQHYIKHKYVRNNNPTIKNKYAITVIIYSAIKMNTSEKKKTQLFVQTLPVIFN